MKNVQDIWLAVVNPHAGSGKTISEWGKAEGLLKAKGVAFECRRTGEGDNASMIAYRSAKAGYRKFIAVGGDGTVHDVLSGVMDAIGECPDAGLEDFTLAVVPIGSGNDWIRGHGIPHDTESVVELIVSGSFSTQDVVRVSLLESAEDEGCMSSTYMINVGGVGLDAMICERVNRQKAGGASGKMLYIKSLLYNLFHYSSIPMRVECDGMKVFEGPCYSIAFGIGKYSGGGMRQTPEAVMDDGLLDFTIIPSFSIFRIMREAYKLLNGKILTIKELIHGKARTVKVVPLSSDAGLVEVDGETLGALPVRLEVLPHQIRVLHGR